MFQQAAVLLGLDERDETLIAAVSALARRGLVGRIYVVHVVERGGAFPFLRARGPLTTPAGLDECVAALSEALPGIEVIGVYAEGRAAEEVARLSEREGLDLLIIGRSPGEDGAEGWGGHGLRLLRTSDCSVLVVPDMARIEFDNAAVGMDFSETAIAALRVGLGLCDAVRAVAVVEAPTAAIEGAAEDDAFSELEIETRQFYTETVGPALAPAELPPLHVLAAGSPAEALLNAAADVDILIIGSRGLTPLAAVLLGSTAERLGGRCAQPLLVHRRKGAHVGIFGGLLKA